MTSNVGPDHGDSPPSSLGAEQAGPTLVQQPAQAAQPLTLAPGSVKSALLVEDEPFLDDRPRAGYSNGGAAASVPHMAMPQLMGAPAYARPPRTIVGETPRPFDPDDLPLEAFRTEEEHRLATAYGTGASPAGAYPGDQGQHQGGRGPGGASGGLRGIAARFLGSRT